MLTEIQVTILIHYGTPRIYPVVHSRELSVLTGKKTLDYSDIKALTLLGFTVRATSRDARQIAEYEPRMADLLQPYPATVDDLLS